MSESRCESTDFSGNSVSQENSTNNKTVILQGRALKVLEPIGVSAGNVFSHSISLEASEI